MKTYKYSGTKNGKPISGYIKAENHDNMMKYLSDIGIEKITVSEVITRTISIDNDIKVYKYNAYIDASKKAVLEGMVLSKSEEEAKSKLFNEFGLTDISLQENDINFIYPRNIADHNLNNFFMEVHNLLKWVLFVFVFYIILVRLHVLAFFSITTTLDINNSYFVFFIAFLFLEFIIVEYNINQRNWLSDRNVFSDLNQVSFFYIFILGIIYFINLFGYVYIELPLLGMILIYSFTYFIMAEYNEDKGNEIKTT